MSTKESTRLSSEDRRAQILAAATKVFGERGYVGATTDAIARQAGISQAYVVRMFGSKEQLFMHVVEHASGRVCEVFRREIETFDASTSIDDKREALGSAYAELLADRGILLALLHAFGLGHDPVVGPLARKSMLDSYRVVRDEAGLSPADASSFFAQGMLITVLMAMRMPDEYGEPDPTEMLQYACGVKLDTLLAVARDHDVLT
jgi:AcrR family transcriptional regulator